MQKLFRLSCIIPAALGLATLIGHEKPSDEGPPKAHEQAEGPMKHSPIDQAHLYVCGIHFVNGQPDRQVTAHHYCVGNGDVFQCVLFDGNGKDARLIGIEYIVSEEVFKTLPAEEKALWHSHDYEVKSGLLVAPGMPEAAEHDLMSKLVTTYGKTVHTWQVDRGDKLPLGPPTVMMGFTGDGQVKPELVKLRDQQFEASTAAKKKARADIPQPRLVPGANAWQAGKTSQIEVSQ
jgi:Protein of unknown function (DUF1264)